MKSKPDQTRMTVWLASATSGTLKTADWDQARMSATISKTSKADVGRDPETLARDAPAGRLNQVQPLGPGRIDHHEFMETAAHAHQSERGRQSHRNQHYISLL